MRKSEYQAALLQDEDHIVRLLEHQSKLHEEIDALKKERDDLRAGIVKIGVLGEDILAVPKLNNSTSHVANALVVACNAILGY